MDQVKSTRSIWSFYGVIALIFITAWGIAAFMITVFINEFDRAEFRNKIGFLPILIISMMGLAVYFAKTYFKHAPTVIIDKNRVQFNNRVYSIDDIAYIKFSGKYQCGLGYILMEGAEITFQNGAREYIFDSMFTNFFLLKQYLRHVIKSDEGRFEASKIEAARGIYEEHYYSYKGYFLLNFRTMMLLFIISLPLFIKSERDITVPALVITVLLSLLFSRQFNYFGLSDKYFRIKNHIRFWKNDLYRIEDIEEVVFESDQRAPHGLRLILKDFTTKFFLAATLNDSKWKELEEELTKYNIKVRNLI